MKTDRRALSQILLCLTTNGIKFTDHGSVSLSLIRAGGQNPTVTEFKVTDTGVGILLEDQEKLFSPVYADCPQPGFPGRFRAASPRQPAPGEPARRYHQLPQCIWGGERIYLAFQWSCGDQVVAVNTQILVIEDNFANLELMSYLLTAFGYTTETAPDGATGIACARVHRPDLIICDVQIPVLDGFAVARELKTDPLLRSVPLIAVTAYAMVGDRDRVLAAGFDGYTAKPLTAETFVPEIESYLPARLRSVRPAAVVAAKDGVNPATPPAPDDMTVPSPDILATGMLSPRLASQLAALGLVLVLLALTTFTLWMEFTTRAASSDLRAIVLASDAVGSARDMAGDERMLTDEYRLAPSPEILAQHAAAGVAFANALAGLPAADQPDFVVPQILKAHAEYIDAAGRMFAALRNGDTAAADDIRTEQMDPVYAWFDTRIDAAASAYLALAHSRLDAFDALVTWISTASLAVFALGLSFIGVLWFVLGALGRRAERDQAEVLRVNAETAAVRELVRTKDDLVAMVSHELGSPVTNLVAYADLLAKHDHSDFERKEMLTAMVLEGQRLTALIREFLDIRRLEAGRFVMNLLPTDLMVLLEHTATIARRDVDHPLQVNLPDSLPLVHADAARVLQILANLLSNARKYTPAGREIRLSARQIDGAVEVCVADDGLGIPAEALPRLFEKFYRVPGEERQETKGTGLGLAVTRELVEAQSGQIGLESAGVGRGSRFWFTLPVGKVSSPGLDVEVVATSSTPHLEHVQDLPRRVLRLLVVDDEPAVGSMVRRVVRTSGYETVTATSADEALEFLRSQQFDIVLSDLGLGTGMDGLGLAECVRREWHIPFVLASGAVGLDAAQT